LSGPAEPDDAPTQAFDLSRRLTGANRWFPGPAVVLTPLGPRADDPAAHAGWARRVQRLCALLGWPDPAPVAHRHPQGAMLAFAAPEAALFTATEVNEWAWEREAGAGFEPEQPVADTAEAVAAHFAARAAAEHSRPLAALKAAAAARALPAFEDDDTLSLGAGRGSVSYPRAALPLAMDVPWPRLHGVPTVLVTGSNGKTTTTRLLAAMAREAGLVPGLCSTEGIVVGTRLVEHGDYAGPAGARAVLRHGEVEVALLETARGGILRRGLAVARADAAVVTNVSADHLGEYGIATVEDIAEAKLAVAHAVRHDGGTLVLNARDVVLRAVAARLPHAAACRQALFDAQALPAGPRACGVREGRLVCRHDGVEHELGAVAALPLTLDGSAAFHIENIAAATLAAAAIGLPWAAIGRALARFGAAASDNPGRLERHRHRGATVLVDYAHNPDGLAKLLAIARALAPRRLLLLLGQAGNRDDAAITELARTAAAAAPDEVVIKELPAMLRGRAPGEVPALLKAGLRAGGVDDARIGFEADEERAARRLLAAAGPGDVVVLPIHTAAVREALAPEWVV
jgi:UDP-N-acetylmuramyl tripeptide synthase